jgi:chromosomal replication initiator protein
MPAQAEEQPGFNEFYLDKEANLNPKYTFDSFVVGSFNEVAHAAATAVTKNPGSVYNPLFIYGGTGLGKTHLLQAIGNKMKEQNQNTKVFYMTSEKFATEFISAVQNRTVYDFKEKYRRYNLLIIDDIQFFSDKLKIQEEFFHIFNTLYERNNQIVFSSDRSPKHIIGLEERLRSRFEGGMMVDISKPEYESRLAILKIKMEAKGSPVSQEVMEFIAANVHENIRELEGAMNSVIGQSKIKGKILSINEIKEILKKNVRPQKTLNFNDIIKATAEFYNVNEKSLFEKTRKKEVVKPRQIAMFLLRQDLNISYPFIGQKFGQKDHTTVIHAYKKIDNLIKKDDRIDNEIKGIRGILYGKSV